MIVIDNSLTEYMVRAGIDVEKTLERFCGSAELLFKFLLRFPADENYILAQESFANGNTETFSSAVHTLKGVSGNLGVSRVFSACQEVMLAIREKGGEGVEEKFKELQLAYEDAVEIIKEMESYINQ